MVAKGALLPSQIREIALPELVRGTALRTEFEALHAAWTGRGVARWLEWIEPNGPHPIVVLGAFDLTSELEAVLVGLWAPAPVDRFDALFEPAGRAQGVVATSRPSGGAWHFIAVTARPDVTPTHLGLGRLLVSYALDWVRARGHDEARTLSPIIGLPELAALWRSAGFADASLARIVARSAVGDGRPALQILRLHLGGGARLERLLEHSRADDAASGMANLRFVYATDPEVRAAQRERWAIWCRARANVMAQGGAARLGTLGGRVRGEPIWCAPALASDGQLFLDPAALAP